MSLKNIGVFLPNSKQHPTISKDFMNGLRLSLPDYKFCVEGIGFGDNPQNIISLAQKFINQEEVVATTGILGHRGLNQIIDFYEDMNETLVYADFGTTKSIDLSKKEMITSNSLYMYDATYLLGKHFIELGYKNITTSTCYYESGYGFTKAMQESLHENNQATFSGHFITPLHPRENEAELMSQFVDETNPDAIFAFHNGIFAEEHATYLAKNKVNTKMPFYASPFSIDPKILAKFPEIFHNTSCISSWFLNLQTQENKEFIKIYQEKFNKSPTIFSVLGYENGILTKNQLEKTSSNSIISGPRGNLKTKPKQYLWELKWSNNSYQFILKKELKPTNNLFNSNNEENNWHNAYLCH